MANSFLNLIDNTLGTDFNKPAYDPAKGRAKMIKVIDKAAEQHREGKTPPARAWKLGSNGAISFSPKLSGSPVLIRGQETNYVPAERFQDFLSGMKAAVQAGDLDDEIKAALEGETAGTGSAPKGSTGGKRNVSAQSALNIGVAAKRRAANPPSWEEIRNFYVDGGSDPKMVDAAIAKRKEAEKA